jgi:hypothetical protein
MKASLVAYDCRGLHKKLEVKIENGGLSKAAQNGNRPKSSRWKLQGLRKLQI